MLCELALNGIGGNTLEEVQQNLSLVEIQKWSLYRKRRGSLNWGMRMEAGFAMLASMYVNAHRKKGTKASSIHDFMPHHHEDETEVTLEEAYQKWR